MKEPALVIIKPDGVKKQLIGRVLDKFSQTGLEIVAVRLTTASREQVESHYKHIKNQPFFNDVVSYLLGELHREKRILVIVYYGESATKKCRKMAGATNPEDANPMSIRGSMGRVTTKGVYENIVHVSATKNEAKREIKLWFNPDDLLVNLYKSKEVIIKSKKKRVWA